jgi:hypothetical protein
LVESDSPALATCLEDSFFETRRLRKDGWDGAAMAIFIGTLAETGVVTLACRACGMSAKSAYALRHRDLLFEKLWEAALSMARALLADELLARSLKGSAEQLLRDGAIVGERHHFDNKLAFAILRRLDRRAELGATFRTPTNAEVPLPAPAVSGEWQTLLDAISEDRREDVARLVTPPAAEDSGAKGNTEGNDPPVGDPEGDSFEHPRLWQCWSTGEWRTDFPPPPGFDGPGQGEWDETGYWRGLTEDEHAALANAGIAENSTVTLEQDEAERDSFFTGLAQRA